jgi:hypothetical protein
MDVKEAFMLLAEAVKRLIAYRINKYGVNHRIGKNTLKGSNLESSIEVTPEEDGITLQIADYWEFISRGREPLGNYPNTMSQWVKNVDDWVTRKNIRFGDMTQSQIVFAIIRNIINHGIKSRPFLVWDDDGDLEKMIPELNEYLDKWFDTLFDAIINDLNKFFNGN